MEEEDKEIKLDPRQIRKINESIERARNISNLDDFIYICKCHQYHKVGITSHIDNRLNSLQCGNPYPIEVIYLARCPEAKIVEQGIHQFYEDNKVRGEWFLLKDKDIENIIGSINDTINKFSNK